MVTNTYLRSSTDILALHDNDIMARGYDNDNKDVKVGKYGRRSNQSKFVVNGVRMTNAICRFRNNDFIIEHPYPLKFHHDKNVDELDRLLTLLAGVVVA